MKNVINFFQEQPGMLFIIIVLAYVLLSTLIGNIHQNQIIATCQQISETVEQLQNCIEALK